MKPSEKKYHSPTSQPQLRLKSSAPCSPGPFAKRRGTATVELAVCLPVIIILVFGAIEVAHFIHLKQDLTICAYEAAKTAAKSGKSLSDVNQRFDEIARAKGVTNATVSLSPQQITLLQPGQSIVVTAQAPADSNRIMPLKYFQGRQLRASVVMVRQQY